MTTNTPSHSEQLLANLRQDILSNGPLSFASFMEQVLYSPEIGYYMSPYPKLGRPGDFTTAPEMSSLYSECIARQCQQVLTAYGEDILEVGAGTGKMAAQILTFLESQNCLPKHYFILEISPQLRKKQQATILEKIPHLFSKITWLETLANFKMTGVILGNELLDALPVHRFKFINNQLQEFKVDLNNDEFVYVLEPPSDELASGLTALNIDFQEGYESEYNCYLGSWLKEITQVLNQGLVLLIDYGFPRHEYYHPDRNQGTLMCHYQHLAHDNPLLHIGLQDITAHVDFTLVAEKGHQVGLTVAGYTNQANFLLACGIIDLLNAAPNEKYLDLTQEIKILTSPNEMGELFKVMALTKKINLPLLGFSIRNNIDRL